MIFESIIPMWIVFALEIVYPQNITFLQLTHKLSTSVQYFYKLELKLETRVLAFFQTRNSSLKFSEFLQTLMIPLFEDFWLKVHTWFIFWSLGLKIDTHTLLEIA